MADTPEDSPVFLYIHGGGWVVGDKAFHSLPLLRFLAHKKFVVYSINYRLSPKVTFPAHLIDCKRALVWIREVGAQQYGGNPQKIVVGGESAGGHLSLMVSLTQNQPQYQPGFERGDTRVSACVDLYGVHDFTDAEEQFDSVTKNVTRRFLEDLIMKKKITQHYDEFAQASPTLLLNGLKSSDIPPILSVHGTHDTLIPLRDSELFHETLKKVREQADDSGKDVLVTYSPPFSRFKETNKALIF